MSNTKPVELQALSARELLNVCYDSAGQLMLLQTADSTESIGEFSIQSIKKLTVQQQTHLKAAFYWLKVYQSEPDASNLERVRGYLEAFHHFCENSAWQSASQILFTSTQTSNGKELHEQLSHWGYYSEQIELYSQLIGKLNSETDCFCLQVLGGAYCQFGQFSKAINYHNQQLEIACKIGNGLVEVQAIGELSGVYFLLGQHQNAFSYLQQKLAVAREIKARKEEGQALGAFGSLYPSSVTLRFFLLLIFSTKEVY
jgi:tetratricopeptide (TPR) repeat protein